MTAKLLATGLAAAAVVAGATAATAPGTPAGGAVVAAVHGAPLPLDPAAAAVLPTVEQLSGVLGALANPAVPFANKGYLVEGGIGRIEARTADALMNNAVAKGQLPLNFAVSDIAAAGPGAATALVTASGPAMPPVTQSILFVDQGGWKLSRTSAGAVLAMFNG